MSHHTNTRHSSPAVRRYRLGFTLVEMLVSMALILFIMVLMTAAFSAGLQAFRQLKGLGDMEEHLRSTAQILRRDLGANHFEGNRKLSDLTFWTTDGPPRQGFFRIWQGNQSSIEGVDADTIPSFQATNHVLHFTSRLTGAGPGDFATSSAPSSIQSLVSANADSRYQQGGQFRGRWYEVAYFLVPNGLAANGTGAGLFTLYRRQLGILDIAGAVNPTLANKLTTQPIMTPNGSDWTGYSEISCRKASDIQSLPSVFPPTSYPDSIHFNSPSDLTMPARRFGMLPALPGSNEMAGIPAFPLLLTTTPPITPLSSRLYPILGQSLPSSPSVWSDPRTLQPPYSGNPTPWCGNSSLQGADLMLSDVISFDVQVLLSGASDFSDIPVSATNLVFANAGIGVFDTWSNQSDGTFDYSSSNTSGSSSSIPSSLIIVALRVSIRVWDAKTLQARQMTIIQDM